MLFTDEEDTVETVAVVKQRKDEAQDTKLDSIQSAIDSINANVSQLQTAFNSLNSKIDDKYLAQTNALSAKVTNAIESLTAVLDARVTTKQVLADNINADLITSKKVSATEIDADIINSDVYANTITSKDFSTEDLAVNNIATLNKAIIQYLTAVNLAITNFDIENLDANTITADAATIDNITTNVANITKLNADVIGVTAGGTWRTPVGAPVNTELLKITVPTYDGITNIISENDSVNISIMNNNLVSFNQKDNIIYRIDFTEALNVKESYAELVLNDRTFELGVPIDFYKMEFSYKGNTYSFAAGEIKDKLIDENLSINYDKGHNNITFTTKDVETVTDVLIYDTQDSGKNDVNIYLTDLITYKELHIGNSYFKPSYSELVDKVQYKQNISSKSGTTVGSEIIKDENIDLNVIVVDELPEDKFDNTIYIVKGDTAYYVHGGNGEFVEQMAASINVVSKAVEDIATNTENIAHNAADILTNTGNIAENKEKVDKVRSDFDTFAATKAKANGLASLDNTGHIPVEQMPISALIYRGQFDASAGNVPVQDTYIIGDFYIISKAGDINNEHYYVHDWIIWNGTEWERSANANAVTSVNGKEGAVTITLDELGGQEKLISGTNIKSLNGTSLLGAGDISVKTINGSVLFGTGDITMKTVNGNSIMGSGDLPLKTVAGKTLNGEGNISLADFGISIV